MAHYISYSLFDGSLAAWGKRSDSRANTFRMSGLLKGQRRVPLVFHDAVDFGQSLFDSKMQQK